MTLAASLFRDRPTDGESARVYALFEIAHTCVDFGAAMCFLVGSVMFFWESWMFTATWFFVIGSVLFAAKPTLRLWREVRLYRMGRDRELAGRLG